VAEVELAIGGMTCASCAARVEKKLNRMDGVVATVNYATERARVTFADGVTPDDLVAAVARTGYSAELQPPPPAAGTDADTGDTGDPDGTADPAIAALRRRVLVTAALTVPVLALSMIPALQFDSWQWLA
jgi:Cu+-exporting ATPase